LKKIGLTMRVNFHKSINEYQDSIDQRWFLFIEALGFSPVLLPNNKSSLESIHALNGVIFTGGNTLSSLGGDAPERDKLERQILEFAINSRMPILGVCRGMQLIQEYWGVSLQEVSEHVAQRHAIQFSNQHLDVNSYHRFGAIDSKDPLEILAYAKDGVIEAVRHKDLPIQAIMWHPERESNFTIFDLEFFRKHFV
jgi:putative glutamine amidotransferase